MVKYLRFSFFRTDFAPLALSMLRILLELLLNRGALRRLKMLIRKFPCPPNDFVLYISIGVLYILHRPSPSIPPLLSKILLAYSSSRLRPILRSDIPLLPCSLQHTVTNTNHIFHVLATVPEYLNARI